MAVSIVLLGCGFTGFGAEAADASGGVAPQSLAAIARRAELAVREALPRPAAARQDTTAVRIEARTPDPRLRLPPCAEPLQAQLPEARGGIGPRTVVAVRCPGPTRWSVLVPVTVEAEVTVLVASRALSRGVRPGPTDLIQVTRTVQGFSNSYINNLSDVEGFHLAHPLAPGTPLERGMLAADPVVRRGESVTLVAMQGGLEIRATGRALADAAPGAPVRVQNVNSLKIIEGRADNSGRVRVDP